MPSYPYFTGEGTQRDTDAAKAYFQAALDNGSWTADRAVQLNVPEDTYEAAANIVKANCAEIGLKVDVIRRDGIPTIQQNMFWAPVEGYEAVLWSFAPTIDPAKVGMYLIKSLCVDQTFFARWGMLEEDLEDVTNYTAAIQSWARAASDADVKKFAEEFQHIENLGAPCISICNNKAIYACGTHVSNRTNANGVIDVSSVNYYNNDIWNWICYEKA
jgi:ABC-type transport system substrate-binding protein